MTYTSATTSHLGGYDKTVSYTLELKTGHPESNTYQTYNFDPDSWTHSENDGAPDELSLRLVNAGLTFSDEGPTSRTELFGHARFACTVNGAESEYLIQGRISSVAPAGADFSIVIEDWSAVLADISTAFNLSPDATSLITDSGYSTRRLYKLTGLGRLWAFAHDGTGADPGFKEAGQPGTPVRRPWHPGDILLWYDADATDPVSPEHYKTHYTSGAVQILERETDEDGNPRSYYVSGVRAAVESAATGATNVDITEVFRLALVNAGIDAGDIDTTPLGIDIGGPLCWPETAGGDASVSALLDRMVSEYASNLRAYYDSQAGKHRLVLTAQQPDGSEDHDLLHATTRAQPRDIEELGTRVVLTGKRELSENKLSLLEPTALTLLETTGDPFFWCKTTTGPGAAWADVRQYLSDGMPGRGIGVHNLASVSDRAGYDLWRDFIQADLGEVCPIHRIRAYLPPTGNQVGQMGPYSPDPDHCVFWPGLKVLLSEDGTNWFLAAPQLTGRHQPGSMIEAADRDLFLRRARYVKVQAQCYKQGIQNSGDPAIGIMELQVFTDEYYEVVREIDGNASPATYYTYTTGATWQRNYPRLWEKVAPHHKELRLDLGNRLGEELAGDYGITLLNEAIRIAQRVDVTAVCDPRIHLYKTIAVTDPWNGDIGGVMVTGITRTRKTTKLTGTRYLQEPLGTEAA